VLADPLGELRDVEVAGRSREHELFGLVDGNKRLGWTATVVFYDINGMELEAPDDDAYDTVIAAAEGTLDVPELARCLRGWARPAAQ